MRWVIVILALLATIIASHGMTHDSIVAYPIVHRLEFGAGTDYMASSIGDDLREEIPKEEKIYSHSAMPLSLRYSFSFTNPNIRNYCRGGYQGIAVSVLNIGIAGKGGIHRASEFIGYPIGAYVFQGAPFWHINRNLTLDYEWNFGATFGWKPYSEKNERFNLTVGSKVNAYLHLGLKLVWLVNDRVGLYAGVGVSHYSNGNTSWPNPGVNAFGLRLGMVWTLNPFKAQEDFTVKNVAGEDVGEANINSIGNIETRRKSEKNRNRPEYDLTLWGASRKRVYRGGEEPVLLPGHYGCAGVSFAPMWRLGKWWRVGGSADIQWDGSSDKKHDYISGTTTEDIRFRHGNFIRQNSLGISVHGELQMPIFAVNIGLGCNILSPSENRGLYQNITLKTYIGPRVYINVGYQLRNFYQQSNLMLGLGVTI